MSSLSYLEKPAAKRKIIVVDSDYTQGKKYESIGVELENIMKEYVNIIEKLSSASSGKLSDNLESLKRIVESKLIGIISDVYENCSLNMSAYKDRIDRADSDLY